MIEIIKQPEVPVPVEPVTGSQFIPGTFWWVFFLPPLLFLFLLLIVSDVAGLVPAITTLRIVGNSLKLRPQRRGFLYKGGSCLWLDSADL